MKIHLNDEAMAKLAGVFQDDARLQQFLRLVHSTTMEARSSGH